MKRSLLSLAIGLGFSASAMAFTLSAPINPLTGAPIPWDGTFEIKFQNMEAFIDTDQSGTISAGDVNYGILRISSINTIDGDTLWANGQGGEELTGVFGGITVKTVTPASGGFTVDSIGGQMNIYLNALGSFTSAGGFAQGLGGYGIAGCSIGSLCYDGISNVGGVNFLTLDWAAVGVSVLDNTITVSGSFTGLTSPNSGQAAGYLNVTGGDYAYNFDTNGQLGGSDLFSQNDFCTPGQTGCVTLASAGGAPEDGGWPLRSNDPVRGSYIPEPGTLALLGIGLLGMGFSARRRKV